MTEEELQDLLKHGESDSLDWKREFPPGLLKPKTANWDKGRATLLKDIVTMANGEAAGPGYLVFGVEDRGYERTVIGISRSWDDATFQTWAENIFQPVPKFSYSEVSWESSTNIGVFRIDRVPEYPHVVVNNIGGVLFDGQVWFRRGSKNTVAYRSDLERMFKGEEPFKISKLDDPVFQKIINHYKGQGREVVVPLFGDRDSRLSQGYELAHYPESRREVWVGYHAGRYEHIALLKPR